MANPEHLRILKRGGYDWNEWRGKHREILIDLSRADLFGEDLRGVDLNRVDLSRVILVEADLGTSDLSTADLRKANLSRADLSGAVLSDVDLAGADLSEAVLYEANLAGANVIRANLRGADLRGADLSGTVLASADLRGAAFTGADLSISHLSGARLHGADFTEVMLAYTAFADNDLSQVKGLETVNHLAPSSIGLDTIYKSQGNIPEVFLRGCGVPEDFITYMRSLTQKAIMFYSCFISYSSADQEFAERLHADLQTKGVRVWFAPHDLPIGARIRPAIDESIRVHDKLLLVLSEASVSSQWVEQEVETALAREREQEGKTILFPVRIDDVVMETKSGWPALLRNTRNVGDFTRWKDHDSYRKALERLLRDLKAEESKL